MCRCEHITVCALIILHTSHHHTHHTHHNTHYIHHHTHHTHHHTHHIRDHKCSTSAKLFSLDSTLLVNGGLAANISKMATLVRGTQLLSEQVQYQTWSSGGMGPGQFTTLQDNGMGTDTRPPLTRAGMEWMHKAPPPAWAYCILGSSLSTKPIR